MGFLSPAKVVISTKREHSLEEVRDTLNQHSGFPSAAVIGGVMGSKGVYLSTDKYADVWLRVQKDKITVTLRQMPRASNMVGGVVGAVVATAIDGATGGVRYASWQEFIGNSEYKADDLVHAVANRVQQIFGA